VAPGRVSCCTHWIATLFSCTWIIADPVSHVHSKQYQCKMADIVDALTRQGELQCFSKEFSYDRHSLSNVKVEKVC